MLCGYLALFESYSLRARNKKDEVGSSCSIFVLWDKCCSLACAIKATLIFLMSSSYISDMHIFHSLNSSSYTRVSLDLFAALIYAHVYMMRISFISVEYL